MKNIFIRFVVAFIIISVNVAKADEGMWLLHLLKQQKIVDMQSKGCKLTAEQIYSVNQSSVKDAVVNFGNFCTGELISDKGLILTNHHCGFDAIQSHSTVENDYLTKGFWAKDLKEEKKNQGLTVSFLVRIEDVSEKIYAVMKPGQSSDERAEAVENVIKEIEEESISGTTFNAEVKDFFAENQYILFIYETFEDVRLVGAPPSSIGKFGGDTDNWMWPRHTGDFSLFRVYCAPDGSSAPYSEENIPLKPRHYFPISLKGVQQNDYAMVLGYPGSTERYLSSYGVKLAYEQSNPSRVKIREKKLAIIKSDMNADGAVKIQYASKYASVSNYYKYFIGQNQGLKNLDVIARKEKEEAKLKAWIDSSESRQSLYGDPLKEYDKIYSVYQKVITPYVYLEEAAFGIEGMLFAYEHMALQNAFLAEISADEKAEYIKEYTTKAEEHFKDYNTATDQKLMAALLKMVKEDTNPIFHSSLFTIIKEKYNDDFDAYAKDVYAKSFLVDKAKYLKFMKKPSMKKLAKDPLYLAMFTILSDFRNMVGPYYGAIMDKLTTADNVYMKALLEYKKEQKMYPDANFTMRLTYGQVLDCKPSDKVYYNFYTTLDELVKKEDPNNEEFIVEEKLKELHKSKDFGDYKDLKGHMPVCFITNNDITGGNSGSPVLNGEGQLIGVAFDGNWEAMSGDIIYEPEIQRTISVDIRYVLFIIDKFAGAQNLIEEMTIIK